MDPYQILGIDKDASIKEINKAYRMKALKYMPHKELRYNEEYIKWLNETNEAYNMLIKPIKKDNNITDFEKFFDK